MSGHPHRTLTTRHEIDSGSQFWRCRPAALAVRLRDGQELPLNSWFESLDPDDARAVIDSLQEWRELREPRAI